ncbi:MAG: 50S ribosomal protein L19e [Candidatus ainarchaeum sp.]|nr:50S ribosomal protein L19e [Candidatus ainarchaeum sp.]
MSATTVKRLAADILCVGVNRIRLDKDNLGKVEEALTRADVRGLVDEGVVYAIPKKAGHRTQDKSRQGRGRRKGNKKARMGGGKSSWMVRIRSQRAYLEQLLGSGELPKAHKRTIYLKIKGGAFKGKAAMKAYLAENRMLKAKE